VRWIGTPGRGANTPDGARRLVCHKSTRPPEICFGAVADPQLVAEGGGSRDEIKLVADAEDERVGEDLYPPGNAATSDAPAGIVAVGAGVDEGKFPKLALLNCVAPLIVSG